MITYQEAKILPYSAEQLYVMVADIEQYPTFLPWCKGARIKSRTEQLIIAELLVRFGVFRSAYTSRVSLTPFTEIAVMLEEGPFNRLTTLWHFKPVPEGGTGVSFDLSFEFQSTFLQKAAKMVFDEASQKMMQAFEGRARQLYQP
jgi:coenzyme Q-binding protein COQ10